MKKNKEYIKKSFGSAESEWDKLDKEKSGNKDLLWEECAALTLPYLYPYKGHTENSELRVPYNSIGAAAVNNLASKLTLALIPSSGNFFRLIPFSEITEKLTPEEFAQLDKELRKVELDIDTLIKIQGLTVPIFEAVKLLIVTGNTLLYKVKGGSFKVFNPRSYCVERDFEGNVMSMVIKEKIDKRLLPDEFEDEDNATDSKDEIDTETIYTCVYRVNKNRWVSYQEVCGQVLESTIVEYTNDELPYIPLRWTNVHNENYGRGLVEQYLGDFRTIESAQKSITEGAAIASKVVFGLKPNSTVRMKDIKDAKNGDVILGDMANITSMQTNKHNDFSTVYSMINDLQQRLGKAFLMFTSSIRDSERTTSAEVKATVSELDQAFGGTYAVLAQDLQLPLIKILLKEVKPQALKITTPSIITGSAAISRERDIQNLDFLLSRIGELGPEAFSKIKIDGVISQFATALGFDAAKIIKSQAEQMQEQQQLQEQQMQQQAQPQPQQIGYNQQ